MATSSDLTADVCLHLALGGHGARNPGLVLFAWTQARTDAMEHLLETVRLCAEIKEALPLRRRPYFLIVGQQEADATIRETDAADPRQG